METHEFVTVFCLFSISRAGFSSVARKPLRSARVNGVGSHEIGSGFNSCKGAMFRKPFTTLFQASWLSFEAFTSHS